MELDLNGRTAIVTGASRGVGLAVARRLSEEGVRVLGTSRTVTPELTEAAEVTVAADLATADGARTVVETAVDRWGGVDLLVNNAGGGDSPNVGGFADLADDDWQALLDLNLMAAVRVTRAALPSLLERGGAVVNVSSIGGIEPAMPGLAYNTAKAALRAFGKGLATELAPRGVRVNTVAPGPVLTPMWTGPDGLGARLAAGAGIPQDVFLAQLPQVMGVPTGRLCTPEEVAALVVFLLSPVAASITGSEHRVDGGLVHEV